MSRFLFIVFIDCQYLIKVTESPQVLEKKYKSIKQREQFPTAGWNHKDILENISETEKDSPLAPINFYGN